MTRIPVGNGTTSRQALEEKIRSLGPWFHDLDLHGVRTAPHHFLFDYPNTKWKRFAHAVPQDLTGKSVLDIGCNAGFYSMEMKKRGAERVLGIDDSETYLKQAEFAAEVNKLDIEFRKLSVYDVKQLEEKFDLIIFMGVLYHLRHPLLALDQIHTYVSKDLLLFQSMHRGVSEISAVKEDYDFWEQDHFDEPGYPKMHFVEKSYAGDPTNWWIPNKACTEALLRSAGFQIISNPEEEVYLCRHE